MDNNFVIDSETRVYGIIGNPVRHSLSPIMHNIAFSKLGLNCIYLAFHVEDIKEAIIGVKALGIQGLSVTIPHKTTVIPHLDWVDPIAYRMNAVNTIVNENGVLKGYNSDGIGAYLSITGNNIDLNDKNVLIIGNGGTAKSIAYTIIDRAKINRLNILGRDKERVEAFINRLKEHTNFHQISSFYRIDDDNLVNAVQNSDIIINTSPIGMSPNDKLTPIPVKLITEKHVIFDVVYKPLKTMLLKEAEKRNATIINGLEMLINQGVVQFELWTKKKAPKTDMYDAIKGKIII